MKKLFAVIVLFFNQINFAQNTFPASGSIEVYGNGIFNGALISSMSAEVGGQLRLNNPFKTANGSASGWNIYNMTGGYGNSLQFWAYDNLGCVPGGLCENKFTIMDNGNVGIGLINPVFKLDVNGILNVTSENNGGALRFNSAANGQSDSRNWYISSDGYAYGDLAFKASSTSNGVPNETKLIIKSNGNLGLGTSTPDEKLTVKGKIHTQEVRVDMAESLVPDYVFAENYNLRSLQEVEDYIKNNKHLPEIPSAKEIEQKGLMLAEMNMNLLKKIEEITIYVIEQQKNTEKLQKTVQVLSERLHALEIK